MSYSRLASLCIHIWIRSLFSFSLSILLLWIRNFFFLLACSHTVLYIIHSISFLSDDDALPFPLSSLASRDQPYTTLRSVTITLIIPFFPASSNCCLTPPPVYHTILESREGLRMFRSITWNYFRCHYIHYNVLFLSYHTYHIEWSLFNDFYGLTHLRF